MDKEIVESILKEKGYLDFRWTHGDNILVRQWVRFKCMFGCDSYGQKGTCPPNVPSVEECQQFFSEYENIVIIHLTGKFKDPDERKEWSRHVNKDLLNVERAVFLKGYQKAFLLFMDECRLCSKCPGNRVECKHPGQARPSPEALAVDVFNTVRGLDLPIEVLKDTDQVMNRYAFLLVE